MYEKEASIKRWVKGIRDIREEIEGIWEGVNGRFAVPRWLQTCAEKKLYYSYKAP